MPRQVNFSENLKKMRLGQNKSGQNFTQSQIARQTGIARSMISDYENGVKEPTLSALVKLSKFFEISLDELCYGKK